jgi:hypothetical protein
VREERDTNGDGIFDLRILSENGQIVAQEADTNGDRRVDVWVSFHNGEQVEQLEDQNYLGKITARYVFKGGQVVSQEQLANADPPRASTPFAQVEEELQSIIRYDPSVTNDKRTVTAVSGMESGAKIK